MKLKSLFIAFFIFISIYIAMSYASGAIDNKVKFNYLVGFQNEAALESEINIKFYEQLNKYKKLEGLSFKELSYLINLLDLKGENARFRWKENIYPDSSLSVSDYNIGLSGNNAIPLGSDNSIYIINRANDKQATKVFGTTHNDFCSISILFYQDNQVTYFTTTDSFGIYLGKKDTMSSCHQDLNDDIKLIDKLPKDVKDKDLQKAEKLAELLDNIKHKHQLTNSQIGKMIAMSNINIGNRELTYTEPYHTNNLIITHNSYQLPNNSENNPVTIVQDKNPQLIVFSTDYNNETTLLGSAELEKFNDLKLIIHKEGSTYKYDINSMKHRSIIE